MSRSRGRAVTGRACGALIVALSLARITVAGATADTSSHARIVDAGDIDGDVADAFVEDASTSDGLDEAIAAKRSELISLLAFRQGLLGPVRHSELFGLDLRNEEAVQRRLAELRFELDIARAAAKDVKMPLPNDVVDASGVDAGARTSMRDRWLLGASASTDVMELLDVRLLELREEILSLPAAKRDALVSAEIAALREEAAIKEREHAEREAALAEEARRKALVAAQEARSNVERQIAEVRASVESARGEQLRARADLNERLRSSERNELESDRALRLTREEMRAIKERGGSADALYDDVVEQLVVLRSRANALLGTLERDERAPRPKGNVDLPATSEPELSRERERLRESLTNLEKEASALETENKEFTWSALRSAMHAEGELNGLRIALLQRVSEEKRARLLGFGEEGRLHGWREIERVRLEIRWLRARGWETLRETVDELRHPAAIARVSVQIISLAALLWLTLTIRRRRTVWLRALRSAAARSIRRPALLRVIQRSTSALDAIASELVTLGALLLVPALPQMDVANGLWSVPYTLLLWYSIYRLALTVAHRTIARAASGGGVLAGEMGERILRSVRLVGRSAFFFAVLLASSAAVVGRGYLHALVVRAAWAIAIPIGVILVRHWRNDIADAYLRVRPSGTLSGLVARTRTRWAGFFVTIAAFVVLLGSGLAQMLRRFVLGFEQSRKALAFFFRRRLERQVEHTSIERPLLDSSHLSFFTEQPVERSPLAVDRYPGLSEFEERFARWKAGHRVGPTLVVGRTGFGKTSWLRAAERRCKGARIDAIRPHRRETKADHVLATLAKAVGAPAAAHDFADLAEFLRAGERRVITVDDAQLWFLRGVEHLEAWKAFLSFMDRTCDTILWLVTFSHYSWEFLNWRTQGDHVFRTIVFLAPWSEAEIGELLDRRNAASGLEIVYDDLLIDDVRRGDESAEILTTARDYNRLVWDYAEGSPRVALHVWGRSLVPDGPGRARVRLFMNPDTAVLESLNESARFVLAAVVWHEQLSVEEAMTSLSLPRSVCTDAFHRLLEYEIGELHDDRLHVTPRWWPVVVRHLRRKHLIET